MSRSLKKPLYTLELKKPKYIERFEKASAQNKNLVIKIWDRSLVISPLMINHTLLVYNGKKFNSRTVTQEMVYHKIGEFFPTRQMGKHGKAGKH